MSCPDWQRLAERGDELPEHLRDHAARCPRCRDAAVAVDPSLLFRRLPAVEVGSADVEAMKQAVAAMRRGNRVAAGQRTPSPRRRRAGRFAWPLAAALLLAILLPASPAPSTYAISQADLAELPVIDDIDAAVWQIDDEQITLVVVYNDEQEAEALDV